MSEREPEPEPAPFPGAEPPPEAYSRVTNPERFAVLHRVAVDLAERLGAEFDVERDESPTLQDFPTDRVVSALRLVPAGEGAPVTLICTRFPGVSVVFGEAHEWGYPICGCDACDEDPDALGRELEADVIAVVQGRFTEYRNDEGDTGYRVEKPGGGYKAGTPAGRLTEYRWPAWHPR